MVKVFVDNWISEGRLRWEHFHTVPQVTVSPFLLLLHIYIFILKSKYI